jgi:enolase
MRMIEAVHARQILDSSGNPTVEFDLRLASGATARRLSPEAPPPAREGAG